MTYGSMKNPQKRKNILEFRKVLRILRNVVYIFKKRSNLIIIIKKKYYTTVNKFQVSKIKKRRY